MNNIYHVSTNNEIKKLNSTNANIFVNKKIIDIEFWLKIYLLFTGDIKKLFKGELNESKNNSNSLRIVSFIINIVFVLIFFRSILLVFKYDTFKMIEYYLGHKNINNDWKHISFIIIISIIFTCLIYIFCFYSHNYLNRFSWLEPFAILSGYKIAYEFDFTNELLSKFIKRSQIIFYLSIFLSILRTIIGLIVFYILYYHKFNYVDEQRTVGTLWFIIFSVWIYFSSGSIYILSAFFDILCYYFELRFDKMNDDITKVVQFNNNYTVKYDSLELILKNHDFLCKKIDEYSLFWNEIILFFFFANPLICSYCIYQIGLFPHTDREILTMSLVAFEASFLFSKLVYSACKMSKVANRFNAKLIKVQLDLREKYYMEKLSDSIDRLFHLTISFHCSDLFEITFQTYYYTIIGISQFFFLVTDFISIQYSPVWSKSSFNRTLNANRTTTLSPLTSFTNATTPLIPNTNSTILI